MLAAAEAAMDLAAGDDAERERNRARLYAPPPAGGAVRGRGGPAARGMAMTDVQTLMAQMAAEDSQHARGRNPSR
ncbi:hypothetical protein [Nonomuraea turcica]|uniref:hypothetical protein n=1 Tax=Nonomuraea sp. G32 TaxID=3067274 RepID=UPI00273AFDC7|nr:hypothetical protein [Nonomuraea sp. G32]MDP4501077.1 hypothetical protein [Nonomuraea sp. G32]